MKPNSSATSLNADFCSEESSDLDETVELPAAFVAETLNASNDEYPEISLREAQRRWEHLAELGESIHNTLTRIATALENLPAAGARSVTKRKVAAASRVAAGKRVVKKTASRKKVSKKKASGKRVSAKKASARKASTTTPAI